VKAMIAVAVTARCLGCGWTAGPGGWAVDRETEKHTRPGHPTATLAAPAASPDNRSK